MPDRQASPPVKKLLLVEDLPNFADAQQRQRLADLLGESKALVQVGSKSYMCLAVNALSHVCCPLCCTEHTWDSFRMHKYPHRA